MQLVLMCAYSEMTYGGGILIVIVGGIVLISLLVSNANSENTEHSRRALLSNEQRKEEDIQCEFGRKNSAMICPHCQTRGKIRVKPIEKKTGISGGKATAAVLTGGISLVATGLSRKDNVTQAHCEECNNTWVF